MVQLSKIWSIILAIGLLLVGWWIGRTKQAPSRPDPRIQVRCAPGEAGYACSMHPTIRLKEAGNCLVCGMPLSFDDPQSTSGKEAVVLPNTHFSTIEVKSTSDHLPTLQLGGKVVLDESKVYIQVAHLPGHIERLYPRKAGDLVEAGQPIASIYSKELINAVEAFARPNTPESLKRSAQNNLRAWKLPDDQIERMLAMEDYRVAVDIPADRSGIIIERHALEGEQAVNTIMGAPTPLFTIAELDKVWVRLEAYESDLSLLHQGQQVAISCQAYPDKQYPGQIIEIGPILDEEQRIIPVIVEVANPDLLLRPGLLAQGLVELVGLDHAPSLRLPKSAVLWTGQRSVVYVLQNPHTEAPEYAYREVQIGRDFGQEYEITGGLSAGEHIVIEGAFTIDAAAQLQGKHSMMNPPKRHLTGEIKAQRVFVHEE